MTKSPTTQKTNTRILRSSKIIIKQQKNIQKNQKTQKEFILLTKVQMRKKIVSKLICKNKKTNVRKSNSKVNHQTFNFDKQIFSPHRQKYQCSICLEIMIHPTLTPCGHAFCLPCFQQSLKHKKSCSICRETISCYDFKPSKTLTQIISLFKRKNFDKEDQESYFRRLQDFKVKDRQRSVSWTIKMGDTIDYCKQWQWLQGKVANIYQNDFHETYLTIRSNSEIAEFFDYQITSRLIAKHRYFTKQNRWNQNSQPSHIRIQIFDIANFLENSQFFSLSNIYARRRRVERQVISEDSEDQFLRFTFSFQPRNN